MENSIDYDSLFELITGIIITLGLFATIFFAIYYTIQARNKERLALIEKGHDITSIYKKRENKNGFFKLGFIFIGIALGLIFGIFFGKIGLIPLQYSILSMMLLFGGGAILLANYLILKEKQ